MKTVVLVLLIASSAFAVNRKREALNSGALESSANGPPSGDADINGEGLGSSFGGPSRGPPRGVRRSGRGGGRLAAAKAAKEAKQAAAKAARAAKQAAAKAGAKVDKVAVMPPRPMPVIPMLDGLSFDDDSEASETDLGFEFIHNEQIIDDLVSQQVQPEWITRMGITPQMIFGIYPTSSEDFVRFDAGELKVTDSETETEKTLKVTGVKTDVWCFITFKVKGVSEIFRSTHEFLFPCEFNTAYTLDLLFLREMDDACEKPVIKKPSSTTVEKCMWYYKKIAQAYDFNITEMGAVDGAEMLECYVEAVKEMVVQPRVEIQCVAGGIVESDHVALTREQFIELKKTHVKVGVNEEGNTVYSQDDFKEKDTVTKIEAS